MSILDQQYVAENDRTFVENVRTVNRRCAAGKVTPQQANNLRTWLQASAVRRFQRQSAADCAARRGGAR